MATDAPRSADIAAHQELREPGPNPVVRAVIGVLLGLAAGVVAALVTPRPHRASRPPLDG